MNSFGLIFDMDGVVADTTGAHRRSWERLAAEEGLRFGDKESTAVLGRNRRDSLNVLLAGQAASEERVADLLARKQAYFLDEIDAGLQALPGVRPLIAEARRAGVPLGLASSSRNVDAVLSRLGLIDSFDAVADGTTPCAAKPAPDLFLIVARALDLRPARCTVLEDSAAGVAAALAGGFAVVGLGTVDGGHRTLPDLDGVTLEALEPARLLAQADVQIA